jgi:hypothetical protein
MPTLAASYEELLAESRRSQLSYQELLAQCRRSQLTRMTHWSGCA